MTTISPETMTTAEKISTMEIIWDDLCNHSSLKSPDWHKSVLTSRQQQHTAGNQTPLDWKKAKQKIRNKI